MSDLISRKALLETFEEHKSKSKKFHEIIFFDAVMAIIDTQPTTYDVDKVVEELEKLKQSIDKVLYRPIEFNEVADKFIEIVKGSVKDE